MIRAALPAGYECLLGDRDLYRKSQWIFMIQKSFQMKKIDKNSGISYYIK